MAGPPELAQLFQTSRRNSASVCLSCYGHCTPGGQEWLVCHCVIVLHAMYTPLA
jgi:hypothetical protein